MPKSNAKKHSDADELALCMCHCDGKAWFAAESGVKDPSNPAIGGLSRPKFGRMIFNHCLVLGHEVLFPPYHIPKISTGLFTYRFKMF